jgi:predicted nucleic acid-binding protein
VAEELLLDTGAFVALVNPDEKQHAACVSVLANWRGSIVTTEAVLTETLSLVGTRPGYQQICLEFFLRGAFVLFPVTITSLERVAILLKKYRDVPMDFADATLVALGEQLETNLIFTLDRRDFSIYRLNNKASFRIVP